MHIVIINIVLTNFRSRSFLHTDKDSNFNAIYRKPIDLHLGLHIHHGLKFHECTYG